MYAVFTSKYIYHLNTHTITDSGVLVYLFVCLFIQTTLAYNRLILLQVTQVTDHHRMRGENTSEELVSLTSTFFNMRCTDIHTT